MYSVRFVKIRAHEVAIAELNNLPHSRVILRRPSHQTSLIGLPSELYICDKKKSCDDSKISNGNWAVDSSKY